MELKPVTVTLNNTERITLNKCKERQDEVRLLRLYHKLRMYSSHNAFARECLEYYIKNYTGNMFKSATFSCGYLEESIRAIEANKKT